MSLSLLNWSLLGIPGDLLFSSLLALIVGIFIIWVSNSPRLRGWFRLATELRRELTRDIGIALLVAAIISLTYEWNTRVTADHRKTESIFNTVMGSIVTPEVWSELNSEVVDKQARRGDVEINIKLRRNEVLPNGDQLPAPENQAILWMEYKYDLYNLKSEYSTVDVEHGLDSHMRNDRLNMPRFEKVAINGEVQPLNKILQQSNIVLRGVELPSATLKRPVQISTERYEIVGLPGTYTLVLPEIVTGPIKVSVVEPLPEGVEIEVQTGWSLHRFEPDANKRVWTLNGIMLPGQSIIMLFKNTGR